MVFFSKNSLSFSDEIEKSLDSSDEQTKTNKKKSNTKSTANGIDLEWFDGSSEQESYDGNKIKSLDNKAKKKLAIQLIRDGIGSVSKEEKKNGIKEVMSLFNTYIRNPRTCLCCKERTHICCFCRT